MRSSLSLHSQIINASSGTAVQPTLNTCTGSTAGGQNLSAAARGADQAQIPATLILHRASDGRPERVAAADVATVMRVAWSDRGRRTIPPAAETWVGLEGGRGGFYVRETPGEVYRALHLAKERDGDRRHVTCASCGGAGDACACALTAA